MDRVTGQRRYTADVPAEGALHVAFVSSTSRHARVSRIETSAARALPGVELVLTWADIGDRRFGTSVKDYPVLAHDRVLFAGQRLAAVAAVDVETARRAAELVHVEYEPLPVVADIDAVMSGDAEVLHPTASSYEGADDRHPDGNLQGYESLVDGDTDEAFADCDELLEATYEFGRSHSAALEPHSCLAHARDGRVELWTSNKVPNRTREAVAQLLGREPEHVVVHPSYIGGDFGSKSATYLEGVCALMSERTGRPVRATLTFAEVLTSTAARHPGQLRVRAGLRDGRLHVYEGEGLLDGGAFAGIKPRRQRIVSLVGHAFAPYDLTVRDERAVSLYTNSLPGGHVRSPGEFQAVFAGESHVDELARRRGEDPIEFRRQNTRSQPVLQILEDLRTRTAGWGAEPDLGTGVAVFSCMAGRGRTTVACEATREGVRLRVGVPDQGSGMYDSFRRLVADELRVPLERVSLEAVGADTELTDSGAGSSRVTVVAGNACLDACQQLLSALGGAPASEPASYWIADTLARQGRASWVVRGHFGHDGVAADAVPHSHGGLAVELAVDRATGTFDIRRAVLAAAVGRIANPVGLRGQLEGGFVYGLGQALYEQLLVEDGQVVTASLGDYKLPCVADIPPLEIRTLRLPGQHGDRLTAVGELANLGVAPAIGNAIRDAVGVRLRRLPLTAEQVWQALRSST